MQQVSKLGTGAMAKGENPQTSKAERRDTENTHTPENGNKHGLDTGEDWRTITEICNKISPDLFCYIPLYEVYMVIHDQRY